MSSATPTATAHPVCLRVRNDAREKTQTHEVTSDDTTPTTATNESRRLLMSDERLPRNAHFECDCVPDLGPSHCHGCSEIVNSEVEWANRQCAERPTTIMFGNVTTTGFVPTSGWDTLR